MGSYRHRLALAALVLVSLSGTGAWAAEQPPTARTERAGSARTHGIKRPGPTPMVQRGLILPAGLLDGYVSPIIERPIGVDARRRVGTSFGIAWGFAHEMHVDLQLGPLYMRPGDAPATGRVTVTGRFLKTKPVDLGAQVMAFIDPGPTASFVSFVQPGLPAILRPNERLRIDTGVYVPVYPTPEPYLGLRVPLNVYVQITDRYHVGATSAFFVPDLRDPGATASVPIGLTGGYSAGPELRFLAITPFFTWTQFYRPEGGAIDTRSFVAGVFADFIIDLR